MEASGPSHRVPQVVRAHLRRTSGTSRKGMNVRSATRKCWRAKRGVDKLAIGGMLRSDRVAGVCSSIIGAAPPMAKPGRARSRRVSRFKTGTGTHQPKAADLRKINEYWNSG